MTLTDKRAIVTGGSSGIGEAMVALLREGGARVVVLDLNEPDGGGDYVRCDVSDEASVVEAIGVVEERLGGLDLAFLNAGMGGVGGVLDLTAADWDKMLGVDLRGVFLTLRESAKAMIAGGGGSIVITTSICAFLSDRGMSHYNSAKAGAQALARVAAAELGPRGIRVNCIQPGVTETPMGASTDETVPGYRASVTERTPLASATGFGDPRHVAGAAIALANLEWVTGQALAADGGVSLYSPIDPTEFIPNGAAPWTVGVAGVEHA